MLRSMYSGISGMKVNQIKLDVIGNNISNVGTTAFKGSRARFSDMLSQNVSDAMAPSGSAGGRNASQVGMGVQLASIDSVMTQGMMQPTGRALDVGIDGDGFFMVSKGPALYGDELQVNHRPGQHTITDQSLASSGSEIMYSRDGSFILDEAGNLLTGDGFRVLGYSLTNDDSSQPATGLNPNAVNTAGLDFRFGPGSQLNGYKVVLGAVGPGTVTSADVNKADKTIVVNGDFSTGALTAAQVENAVNKGLSSAGISQNVMVTGKSLIINDLGSEGIKGGSDATSPTAVTAMGITFNFTEGSQLNGYSIRVGNISDNRTSATVDADKQEIVINANFIDKSATTSKDIEDAINKALRDEKINQEVKCTGVVSQIPGLVSKSDASGKPAKAPEAITEGGYNIGFELAKDAAGNTIGEKGSQLNGYTFTFTEKPNESKHTLSIDKESKKIQVNIATGDGVGGPLDKETVNNFLKSNGIEDVVLTNFEYPDKVGGSVKVPNDGVDLTAPKNITVAGITMKLPKGDTFNNVEVQIASLDEPDASKGEKRVEVQTDGKEPPKITKIVLRGDFRDQNVDVQALENEINNAIKDSGVYNGKLNADGSLKDSQKVILTGNAKAITGLTSSVVNGGAEFAAPGNQDVFGFDFTFGNGAALNGYTINIGKVSAGTKTSADIDEKNKTITINGDFVTEGAVKAGTLQSIINSALQEKGIEQSIKVTGTANTLDATESDITMGGTPVESMNEDGSINFVDGTGELKSYDGELVTLKIPDKVKIPGTDEELRVKSYTIDKSGVINGVLEDGRVAALGQIAMASFKNPEGLNKLGGNLYGSSVNSGDAIIKSGVGTLGEDNSKGYGDNLQGMLEMSNVDLAEQFTDMIVSSRAFQAAGKMITTGDEILQDIINLKR